MIEKNWSCACTKTILGDPWARVLGSKLSEISISFDHSKKNQESPPAWTQEAYRPRRIKYYPRWGTPSPVGVPPQPGLMGRVPEAGYHQGYLLVVEVPDARTLKNMIFHKYDFKQFWWTAYFTQSWLWPFSC